MRVVQRPRRTVWRIWNSTPAALHFRILLPLADNYTTINTFISMMGTTPAGTSDGNQLAAFANLSWHKRAQSYRCAIYVH